MGLARTFRVRGGHAARPPSSMVGCRTKGIERPHGDGPRPVSGPEDFGNPDAEGAGRTSAGHGDGCGRTTGGGGVVGRVNEGGGRAALGALAACELRRRPRAEEDKRLSRCRATHGHRNSVGQRWWAGPMSWARRHIVHSCLSPRRRWVSVKWRGSGPKHQCPPGRRGGGGGGGGGQSIAVWWGSKGERSKGKERTRYRARKRRQRTRRW